MSVVNVWVGAVTDTTARVVAKVTGASARLAVADNPTLTAPVFYGPVAPTLGIVSLTATGLEPDSPYWFAVEDDGVVDTATTGRFRTHPPIGQRASFTFATASCAGASPDYPGEGTLSGPANRVSNHPVFDQIRARDPLFFAHTGDLHYHDIGSGVHVPGFDIARYREAYDDVLTQPRQHALYRNVPTVYMWDDHDYGPNNADTTSPGRDNARLAYRERVPHYPLPAGAGAQPIYHSFQVGRVLFVATDNRSARSPSSDPDGPAKTMLGAAQKTWLNNLLDTSTAEALVWLNATPWLGESSDTWAGYATERDELVEMFGDHGWLNRMMIASGDHHALVYVPPADNIYGGFPVWHFSSLDSTPTDHPQYANRLPGRGQYGTVDVIDSGHEIQLVASGWTGDTLWRTEPQKIVTSTPFLTGFPAQAAPWRVEIAPGGDPADPATWTWVDVTGSVRFASGISVGYGRPDEWQTTSPSTCDLTLDNRDGRFSPRNPLGPWFGQLGRNTPLRVTWAGVKPRFTGFVSEWPPRWDQSGNNAYVPIRADGITRRLAQGQKPLRSALFREVTAPYRPKAVAYWPCEDESRATSFASTDPAVPPLHVLGTAKPAEYQDFLASEPLPLLGDARLTGVVPPHAATGQVLVRMFAAVPTAGSTDNAVLLSMNTSGTAARWDVLYGNTFGGLLAVRAYDSEGAQIYDSGYFDFGAKGTQFDLSLELRQSGANVAYTFLTFNTVTGGALIINGTVNGRTCGIATKCTVAPSRNHPEIAVGHLTVANDSSLYTDTGRALLANDGERAAARISRLCTEEGIACSIIGDPATSMRMGPQKSANLIDLLREAETADGGVLHEVDGGLAYRTRESGYNRPVALGINGSGENSQLAKAPEPTDDDQLLRNDVTAKRSGGSSARVFDAASVAAEGRYDEDHETNVFRDSILADVAGWRVHLGTVDEMRWPRLSLDLAARPELIEAWMNMLLGDRVTVDHALTQIPGTDIDVVVEGWTERFDQFSWEIELNCSPAKPWDTGIVDDPVLGRIDTDGSAVDRDTTASATELVIATTAPEAPRWSEEPADTAFDMNVGGEHVRVTAPEAALVDSFNRVAANGWGTADTGQAWTVTGTAANFSCTGNLGRVALSPVNASHYTTAGSFTDTDITARITCPVLATGGAIATGLVARWVSATDHYFCQLLWNTDGSTTLQMFKRVAGVATAVGPAIAGPTYSAGVSIHVRFRVFGTELAAKAWKANTDEPTWQIISSDGTFATGGPAGTRSLLGTGNTNPLPVNISYENLACYGSNGIRPAMNDTFDRTVNHGWGPVPSAGQWYGFDGGRDGDLLFRTGLQLPGAAADFASTPDTAVLDITGDLDLRADITVDEYPPAAQSILVGKYNSIGDQRSYRLSILNDGKLRLAWSTTGTAGTTLFRDSTVAVPIPAYGGRLAVRATLDVVDGANHTVTFHTAPSLSGSWTQLGTPVTTAGNTSIFSGSAVVTVGANPNPSEPFKGTVHGAEIRNGINGTVVANPDFQTATAGASSFSDAAGRLWSMNGAARLGPHPTDVLAVTAATHSTDALFGAFAMSTPNTGFIRVANSLGGTHSGSAYVKIPSAQGSGAARLVTFTTSTNSNLASIRANSNGTIEIANGSNTAQVATTNVWVPGQWFRIAWQWDDSIAGTVAAPVIKVRFFPDANTDAFQEITWTASGLAAATARWVLGTLASQVSWLSWMDSVTALAGLSWLPKQTTDTVWRTEGGSIDEYTVTAGTGRVALDSIEERRFTVIGDYADVDIYADISVPAIAAGGAISAGIVARWTDASNFYMTNLFFRTSSDIMIELFKRVDHTFLDLAVVVTPVTYTFDLPVHVRFQCIGDLLRAKVWPDGRAEPLYWHVSAHDIAHPRGAVGTHSNLNSGNTNLQPVPISYHSYKVAGPQRFNVTRAVNGIDKPHDAGTDVRLAHPSILAL